VLAPEDRAAAMEEILFRETGTLGLRRSLVERHKLNREACTVSTPWGPVRGKVALWQGSRVFSPEYEDCARIAREQGLALREVFAAAESAFRGVTK
jgi:uncharacterized protein (DUF111 family)